MLKQQEMGHACLCDMWEHWGATCDACLLHMKHMLMPVQFAQWVGHQSVSEGDATLCCCVDCQLRLLE